MVVRADSLEAGISRYLVDRISAHPNIAVLTGTRVVAAGDSARLKSLTIAERNGQERALRADAMYVLIGGQPLTAGVEGWLRRDKGGYLMIGPDLHRGSKRAWWPLARDPLPLESSQPGVFIAGDVRHGSITRRVPSEKAQWRSHWRTPTSPNIRTTLSALTRDCPPCWHRWRMNQKPC